MFKDKVVIWMLEYIFGGVLVLISLADMEVRESVMTDAYIWSAHLFVVCLGVVLISCASWMRQRILLSRRLDMLAKRLADSSVSSPVSTVSEPPSK
jgi:hypothetical protein